MSEKIATRQGAVPGIEVHEGGGFTVVGYSAVRYFQMVSQLSAMRMEAKGLKMARRSVTAHVKKTYGLRGNRDAVIEQFAALVAEYRRQANEGGGQ